MDKYFEIKSDCKLYNDYFAHRKDYPRIIDAFHKVCETFGIETDKFYMYQDCFRIVPTENDAKNFATMLKKNSFGEFKKNSEPSKMWHELIKDIEHFEKPKLLFYFDLLGYRWSERLFHIEDNLYCSIGTDKELVIPDFAIEMKASEFFKIIEDYENKDLAR